MCPGKMAYSVLNLASHRKVHLLILFQNAEVTFLRWCCLEHVCLLDVECFKTSDASNASKN